ncbi:hypothetical protein [Parendozoicomonas sp. Alg238-R29]|uniref:hypothetical protein n=1 Tax=Parendozoicomonas sp. Alg238-R29 TaxID=2993446 RepID=UPI00248D579E|nr:hypothetical protein [Parendozoicomonas sp. Alg238-R29]
MSYLKNLADVIFNYKVEAFFFAYRKKYAVRLTVIILLVGCFYLTIGNVLYALILGIGIEWEFVDIFTERELLPAVQIRRGFIWASLENTDYRVKLLFLCVNGVMLLFVVAAVLYD